MDGQRTTDRVRCFPGVARIPNVKVVMTPFPHTIGHEASLADARARLEEWGVRQLPVLREGTLAGVLSARDIDVAERLGAVLDEVDVWTLAEREPTVVDLNERLDQVLAQLATRRARCALVTREGRPAGILTATDVASLLEARLRAEAGAPEPGDGVA
jgi:CBS domain-containing protein